MCLHHKISFPFCHFMTKSEIRLVLVRHARIPICSPFPLCVHTTVHLLDVLHSLCLSAFCEFVNYLTENSFQFSLPLSPFSISRSLILFCYVIVFMWRLHERRVTPHKRKAHSMHYSAVCVCSVRVQCALLCYIGHLFDRKSPNNYCCYCSCWCAVVFLCELLNFANLSSHFHLQYTPEVPQRWNIFMSRHSRNVWQFHEMPTKLPDIGNANN